MKIIFFGLPAHGHTNPTLAVVQRLTAQGHQVFYYSTQEFQEKIENTGAVFIDYAHWMPQPLHAADAARLGNDLAFGIQQLVDITLALDKYLSAEISKLQPDLIIFDSMAYWGKLAAQKFGIPSVCSTTTFAFNQHSARVMKQGFADILRLIFSMPKINRSLSRLRSAGFCVNSPLDIIQNANDTNTIVYTSPEFQPCSQTFSSHYVFVGPLLREKESAFPKAKGKKRIYISLGTVNNQLPSFYDACIRALRDKPNYEVILSAGSLLSSLAPLPDNIIAAQALDQIAVLESADVFVTHCGMNSVSEALFYAVPLVLFPQTPEQRGVANRVLSCGAGILLPSTKPDTILSCIETVLNQPDYRECAKKISQSFHNCGGVDAAVDFIERVARTPVPPYSV